MILRFGEYELDPGVVQLRHSGEAIHVEPQVYDVLAYLITNRDRLVPKEELLDEVWGDRFVSESALTSRIKAARQAVGDDGRTQAVIKTAHGRGYRFVAPVEEVQPPKAVSAGDGSALTLPRQARDPILGRDDELESLIATLNDAALVTVVGPGGTGKTRLALEVLDRCAGDAGIMVELAPVRDPEAIPYTVASELGIQVGQRTDALAACIEFLSTTPHLLVLDNCEHVLRSAATMAQSLLEQCDQLTVLATSREPIGLFAERVFRLDPLAVPSGSDIVDLEDARAVPALALFTERAGRVNSDFELTANNVGPVADLCRALDGLPLAIELAASRMGALELDDMLERLDKRLDLVGDARSSVGGRHKTLRSLLEWSYDLLAPDEQRLLRFLAAFPAGATLSSIEWLGNRLELDSDPTLALAHLVEASMIVRSRTTDLTRYIQLDTVQAFGRDQLDAEAESELAQSLLADWARGFAADVNAGIRTPDEGSWDRRARQEVPNLRAARQVLLQRGALGDAMELSRNLVDWLQFRDLEELHVWTDEMYELSEAAEDSVKTTAMAAKAASTWARGDHESAMLLAQEVLERDPDDWSRARATSSMAVCHMYQGEMQAASDGWLRRVEIDGNALDAITTALPIAYLGDVDRAWELFNEGIQRVTAAGWPSVTAWSHYVRGEIEHEADSGLHVDHLERAVREADAVGARFMAGVAKVTLVSGQFREGDRHEAAQGFVELIDQWLRAGNWAQMWVTLRNVAELLLGVDDETAILLFTGADADPFATAMTGPARDELNELLTPALKRLDEETVATIEARARAIDRTEHAEAAAVALRAYLDSGTD